MQRFFVKQYDVLPANAIDFSSKDGVPEGGKKQKATSLLENQSFQFSFSSNKLIVHPFVLSYAFKQKSAGLSIYT